MAADGAEPKPPNESRAVGVAGGHEAGQCDDIVSAIARSAGCHGRFDRCRLLNTRHLRCVERAAGRDRVRASSDSSSRCTRRAAGWRAARPRAASRRHPDHAPPRSATAPPRHRSSPDTAEERVGARAEFVSRLAPELLRGDFPVARRRTAFVRIEPGQHRHVVLPALRQQPIDRVGQQPPVDDRAPLRVGRERRGERSRRQRRSAARSRRVAPPRTGCRRARPRPTASPHGSGPTRFPRCLARTALSPAATPQEHGPIPHPRTARRR